MKMNITALYVCYTRLHDNMHHATDVLVGIVVGVVGAAYTAILWAGMFREKQHEQCYDSTLDIENVIQPYPIVKSPRQELM